MYVSLRVKGDHPVPLSHSVMLNDRQRGEQRKVSRASFGPYMDDWDWKEGEGEHVLDILGRLTERHGESEIDGIPLCLSRIWDLR